MATRAKKLREAAVIRRRIVILERSYIPKFARELERAGEQAANDWQNGGMDSVRVGLEIHASNIQELLFDLYTDATGNSERFLREKFGKSSMLTMERKDGMQQAIQELLGVWFKDSFDLAQSIANTTLDSVRRATEQAVAEALSENAIASRIREVTEGLSVSRSRTIARTESHRAVMESQYNIIDGMDLPEYVNEWASGSDGRVRRDHRKVDGQLRKPGSTFDVGGDSLKYPGDRSGSPDQTINCLLPNTIISGVNPKFLFRNNYVGEVFEIKLFKGQVLTVTPNHPIMTESGFCPAKAIKEGDNLVVNNGIDDFTSMDLYVEGRHPTVAELYDSLENSFVSMRVGGGVVDFHGDRPNSDVEIVGVDGPLRNDGQTSCLELIEDFFFKLPDSASAALMNDGAFDKFLFCSCLPSDGSMGFLRDFLNVLVASFAKSDFISLASISEFEAQILKAGIDNCSVSPDSFSHLKDANPIFIHLANLFVVLRSFSCESSFERVASIRTFHYDGPVYNIEDEKVLYNASTIINHNCRCVLIQSFELEDIRKAT